MINGWGNINVLVTGGFGFIGSNLVRALHQLTANITVMDNLDKRSGGNLYNLDDIKCDLKITHSSILNFDLLSDFIAKNDIVINCAGSTSHSRSMDEPYFDLDTNLKGTLNILEAIRRFNPKCRLIHFGTTTQFGRLKNIPANEMHPEFPTDIYSADKSLSEKHVLIYCKAFNIQGTVLRISNTYGPYASIHSPEFTFNNYFLGQALQGKTINIYGDGMQKRNLLYVNDLIDAVIKCVASKESIGETLLVTSDSHYSIGEICSIIVNQCGSGSIKYIDWPAHKQVTEVGDQIFNNNKARNLLKWSSSTKLVHGLTDTINFYRKNQIHYI
ncbi:NAD(P)-dependent oxidoreductase [Synechococcus sp. BL107]|uniref:NAD-dependent epimerase/dehydratase family protein n=1 Tax=Synechococcus sp. BL107 TaxID=313625 RepID=UPI0002EAFA53|nr:NAD(P)-dependent oxidoreductase [Synechococcus sp. BL107]